MEIKPRYVTYEQAELLKEKEFGVPCKKAYMKDGSGNVHPVPEEFETNWNTRKSEVDYMRVFYSSPEQWQVVEWLRVNHDIWCQVNISKYGVFYCNILQNQPTKNIDRPMTYEMICQLNDFNSPQEAYSAAFDYILTNLI